MLVDVSEVAREAGFKVPVALTAAVWAELRAAEEGSGRVAAGIRPSVGRVPVRKLSPPSGGRIPERGDPCSAPRTGDCVAWVNQREVAYQDESGRLWDVLAMASFEARAHRGAQRVSFSLLRVPSGGLRPVRVRMVLHIGPGDWGEPVITILQPGED